MNKLRRRASFSNRGLDPSPRREDAHALQIRLNRASAPSRHFFEPHRHRVTELVLGARRGEADRVCILGAGNCNDVDLPALAEAFREIHLVDLDRDALDWAVRALTERTRERITLHAPVDVSGLLSDLAPGSDLQPLIDRARTPPRLELGARFDVVVSACVLTQIVLSLLPVVGQHHQRVLELVRAVRAGHFASMLDALEPGGRAVFVSDLVSSDTYPGLAATPASELGRLAADLVARGNFFSGMNPAAIAAELGKEPAFNSTTDVRVERPWLWQLSQRRSYLAYAITFEKRSLNATERGLSRMLGDQDVRS
jgi:hypothetical protein